MNQANVAYRLQLYIGYVAYRLQLGVYPENLGEIQMLIFFLENWNVYVKKPPRNDETIFEAK